MGRLMKYLGGDSLLYKNLTLEDENGENFSQLYNVAGTTTTDNDVNVNASYLQYGYEFMPKFTILMWGNTVASIPAGWLLCDGRTATVNGVSVTAPDLRGRFVLSYGQGPLNFANTTIGATGGEQNHTLTTTEMPEHTHNLKSLNDDFNNTSGNYGGTYTTPSMPAYDSGTAKTWTDSVTSAGSGNAHNNMPPYYVLCYIMKGF
jgi:microcystin-dependent protein